MLNRLNQKYGPGHKSRGKFYSDHEYRWQQDGVQIILKTDWHNYRTHLSYVSPTALMQLKKEHMTAKITEANSNPTQAVSVY